MAERQHGVVARTQLRELGLGDDAIDHRLGLGRLHVLHRGVYAVGHRGVSPRGHWIAAILACGPDALLSHLSAAALWDLRPHSGIPHVTVPGHGRHSHPGINVHSLRALSPRDRVSHGGLPVTSVSRTLLDIAPMLQATELHRAFEAAERLRTLDMREIQRIIGENAGRRGIRALRSLLTEQRPPEPAARSELERRFLDFCDEAEVRPPAVNRLVSGFEVDAIWPGERVIVELDGWAFHNTRHAFERDRRRIAALQVAGYRVIPVTYRRLTTERAALKEELRTLLVPG